MKKQAIFRESDHTYWLDGNELISTTRLMRKHGLSTNYAGVPQSVLAAAAERGKLIHKEIEDYINTGEMGFTPEFYDFIRLVKDLNLTELKAETIINNDLVAGTADIMATGVNGNRQKITVLADCKTTAALYKEATRWQLSIYNNLNHWLNGFYFDKLFVFHLGENSKVVELEEIDRAEVARLFECERNGEIYAPPSLDERLLEEAEKIEVDYQIAKAKREEVTLRLLKKLKEKNIKSTESAALRITYIPPGTRRTFDAKAFEREHPDLKAKYMKETKTKESLRLSLKKSE